MDLFITTNTTKNVIEALFTEVNDENIEVLPPLSLM